MLGADGPASWVQIPLENCFNTAEKLLQNFNRPVLDCEKALGVLRKIFLFVRVSSYGLFV